MCPSKTTRGFTLTELLAVIAVVAILAAVLFPAISNALKAARGAACHAKLRAIGPALHAYASDNNGLLPWGYSQYVGAWCNQLNSYLPGKSGGKTNPYACPEELKAPTYTGGWILSSYGVNLLFMPDQQNPANRRVPLLRLKRPSQQVVVMDIGANVNGNGDWGVYGHPEFTSTLYNSEPYAARPVPKGPDNSATAIRWRHRGKANFLFLDGHVQALAPGELLYQNISPYY